MFDGQTVVLVWQRYVCYVLAKIISFLPGHTHKSHFLTFAGRLDHVTDFCQHDGKRDAKPFSLGQKFFLYLSFFFGWHGIESGDQGSCLATR